MLRPILQKAQRTKLMIRQIRIQNYKSIFDDTIELGRVNVFIGENGCGKTNVLEAIAMASASLAGKLDSEELSSRGVRIAKPALTFSSFLGKKQRQRVDVSFVFDNALGGGQGSSSDPAILAADCRMRSESATDIAAKWLDEAAQFELLDGKAGGDNINALARVVKSA